jgi:putative SbcD/Mre11-related phosphoesterase
MRFLSLQLWRGTGLNPAENGVQVALIRVLAPWPALLADIGERVLIVADLHIGLEYELSKAGVNIPFQTERIQGELLALCKEYKPDRLVIAGDVKHGVPITSFQEKRELPTLFEVLLTEVPRIDVTRGNHDGNIQDLATKNVEIHSGKGIILGDDYKIAIFHGHAWPKPKALEADLLIAGHNHPTVLLRTPLGIRMTQRAWVKGVADPRRLAKAFLEQDAVKYEGDPVAAFEEHYKAEMGCPEMILMPTFNDLLGGLPVNGEAPQSLLGPMLRRNAIKTDDFEVYLLDGTYLGTVGFLRELNAG